MDPKYVREHVQELIESETKRNGNPSLVQSMIDLYQEVVVLDFVISQLKRARNLSGPLMKGKVKELSEYTQYSEDFWTDFISNLREKETVEKGIKSMETLERPGLIQLLKSIKQELNQKETEIKEKKEEIENISAGIGNLVPSHIHSFIPRTSFMPTEENPYILSENSPLLGPGKQEPNVRFKTEWVLNSDHSERVLYESETPYHLHELKKSEKAILGHHQLTKDLGIVLYDQPTKISGYRGYAFADQGVLLNRALISYALDFARKRGYSLIETPHFMTQPALSGVTQLSDFEESLYQVGEHDTDPRNKDSNKYLIATSEQPLTAFYKDQVVRSKQLPIRHAGLSHCYRKEAGKHGQDTMGIFRVHQFEKVEQFSIVNPEDGWKEMDRMIKIAAEFYDTLGIKYRIIHVTSNDINQAAAMKYDLEGYFPSSNKYRELVSCTNCTDYMARRIHCRTDQQKLPHFLNGTLCANTRVICCLLETYQDPETGNFNVPDVLVPYMNGITRI